MRILPQPDSDYHPFISVRAEFRPVEFDAIELPALMRVDDFRPIGLDARIEGAYIPLQEAVTRLRARGERDLRGAHAHADYLLQSFTALLSSETVPLHRPMGAGIARSILSESQRRVLRSALFHGEQGTQELQDAANLMQELETRMHDTVAITTLRTIENPVGLCLFGVYKEDPYSFTVQRRDDTLCPVLGPTTHHNMNVNYEDYASYLVENVPPCLARDKRELTRLLLSYYTKIRLAASRLSYYPQLSKAPVSALYAMK
jgi:hypothetical protein